MAEPARHRWTVDEFLNWALDREGRWELIDGEPVKTMSGTRNVHDDVVVNVLLELGPKLRGTGCRPFTADGAVETLPGQIRRPDLGVDRGPRDPNGLKSDAPRIVIEVLSPGTRRFDLFRKVGEYQATAGIDAIVLIDPNAPTVVTWTREGGGNGGGWSSSRHEGLEATVDLGVLDLTLPMRAIYDGIARDAGPPLMPEPLGV